MDAEFSWDVVPDVDGYNVYLKKDAGSFVKQNSSLIVGTSFTASSLDVAIYEAYVRASYEGLESVPSTSVSFAVIDLYAPTNLAIQLSLEQP